ncbi:Zinc transporter ZIP1, partial [Stegodyphus mimosarum]
MEPFIVLVTTLMILLVGNFCCGILPVFFIKIVGYSYETEDASRRRSKILAFFIYFSGGVLISTCFMSLLPASRKEFEKHEIKIHKSEENIVMTEKNEHIHHEGFPLPEFVILCGFFAGYMIEEIICFAMFRFRKIEDEAENTKMRFCSCAKRHTECSRTFKVVKPDQTLFGLEKKKLLPPEVASGGGECSGFNRSMDNAKNLIRSSIIAQPVPNYGAVSNLLEERRNEAPPIIVGEEVFPIVQHTATTVHQVLPTNNLFIFLSLSFFAIYQGMITGLKTSPSWTVLLLVCLQQFLITFVVGTDIITYSDKLLQVIIYVSVFSIMSPSGISLSMFARNTVLEMPVLVGAIIIGLTCGILLYVTFFEILHRRTILGVHGLPKFFAVTLGSGIMAALQYASINY